MAPLDEVSQIPKYLGKNSAQQQPDERAIQAAQMAVEAAAKQGAPSALGYPGTAPGVAAAASPVSGAQMAKVSKPVAGGPNTPTDYPSQPVARSSQSSARTFETVSQTQPQRISEPKSEPTAAPIVEPIVAPKAAPKAAPKSEPSIPRAAMGELASQILDHSPPPQSGQTASKRSVETTVPPSVESLTSAKSLQDNQKTHDDRHDGRSVPATPRSVFEPTAEEIQRQNHAHINQLPLGEIALEDFVSEHNYDTNPPVRVHGDIVSGGEKTAVSAASIDAGDIEQNVDQNPAAKKSKNKNITSVAEQAAPTADDSDVADLLGIAAKPAARDDDSDIEDLLELAAKSAAKKSKLNKPKSKEPTALIVTEDAASASGSAQRGAPSFVAEPASRQSSITDLNLQPVVPATQTNPPSTARVTEAPSISDVTHSQSRFQSVDQGAQIYSAPLVADHLPRCPHCYVPLEGGSRFCGECGFTLPERIPSCQNCAQALEPAAKFCGECGARQSPSQTPAPLAVAASIGVTQEQLSSVPQDALATGENFKHWVSAISPQRQENWMVKLLRMLEE